MEGVKLMNRTDTKFCFRINQLKEILNEVLPFYKSVEIAGKRISQYQTLYYDTKDLMLYNEHHNGHLNRYKIRRRTYLDSNLSFLEVKFKNNKGRTVKERIKEKDSSSEFESTQRAFLSSELPFNPDLLKPVVWINYGRITLVNKENAERVTIDLNLHFKKENKIVSLNNLVIAEVKQEKKKTSPFLDTMKKYHVREGSISKYCFAIALTHGNVKKNNFKQKINSIQNIINYDNITSSHRNPN